MLSSLRIRNFRALQDLHVPRLGRVNLIVGKNNSGKSTILEALRVYAAQGNPAVFFDLLEQHDEVLSFGTGAEEDEPPHRNFFTGRQFPADETQIYIGDSEETDFLKIEHRVLPEESFTSRDEPDQGLFITSSRYPGVRGFSLSLPRKLIAKRRPGQIPVGYVPPGVHPTSTLAEHWDALTLTSYDQTIIDGLRIIEPDVEGVAFVKHADEMRGRTPIVKLAGQKRPVALASMGDGMMRVLQLLLLLAPARAGLYLADEFENGLHYSVQERVWDMIFKLAKDQDAQVFATTHSWDCIEAFRTAAQKTEEPAVLLRVGRSALKGDEGKTIATVFDKDELETLNQLDVEVR